MEDDYAASFCKCNDDVFIFGFHIFSMANGRLFYNRMGDAGC